MQDYIEKLMKRGEMRIVERSVDPRFELAAVMDRSRKVDDRPILFRNVKGSALPVVSNIFGSRERCREIMRVPAGHLGQNWMEIRRRAEKYDMSSFVRVPADSSLVHHKSIADLPHIVWREKDGGAYISAGIYYAKDPETGRGNLSFCRTLMSGDNKLIACLASIHDLAKIQGKAEKEGRPLDVAILIGPPPEYFLAACSSMPFGFDEMHIAAAMRGSPIPVRKCKTVDLEVPAETQIVIEGKMQPNVREPEGPFGEWQGFYGGVNPHGRVVEVTSVAYRPDAIFHGLLCGTAEDLVPLNEAFAMRTHAAVADIPGVIDVACTPIFFSYVVKIDKKYEGQAREVIEKAFAANPNYTRVCIVVDKDVDIYDAGEVMHAYLTRGRVDTRLSIFPTDDGNVRRRGALDARGNLATPAAGRPYRTGGRVGIDATTPIGYEDETERSRTPGADELDLAKYFS